MRMRKCLLFSLSGLICDNLFYDVTALTPAHVDVVCWDVLWMNGRPLRSEWIMQPPEWEAGPGWPRPPPFLCHEPESDSECECETRRLSQLCSVSRGARTEAGWSSARLSVITSSLQSSYSVTLSVDLSSTTSPCGCCCLLSFILFSFILNELFL